MNILDSIMNAGNGAATGGASSLTTGAGPGGLLEMLGGALDSNKDGSVLDDITGMIGRTFGRS